MADVATPPQSPCELHAGSYSGYHPVDPKIRFETIGQSEPQLWSAMARLAYTYTLSWRPPPTTGAYTTFWGIVPFHTSPNSPMASTLLAAFSAAALVAESPTAY